jgi:hypothetical protein
MQYQLLFGQSDAVEHVFTHTGDVTPACSPGTHTNPAQQGLLGLHPHWSLAHAVPPVPPAPPFPPEPPAPPAPPAPPMQRLSLAHFQKALADALVSQFFPVPVMQDRHASLAWQTLN